MPHSCPINPNEACSGGNPKHDKTIEFNGNTQKVKTTEHHGDPIPRNVKGIKVLPKIAMSKALKQIQ